MIKKQSIKDVDAVTWNDIEALPLYAAALLFIAAIAFALLHNGFALEATTMKVAMIVGCLGLRCAWLGMDDEAEGGGS